MSESLAGSGLASVSVVVPSYNHGEFLPAAIASLQAQTLRPDEIIVVDDGSTDDSARIIAELASADPAIRVIKHERNRGAVAAINSGIQAAKGRYVALVAADDSTMPRLFERLAAALSTAPDAAFASAEVVLTDLTGRPVAVRPAARPAQSVRYLAPAEVRRLLREIDNFILTGAALFVREKLVAAGLLQQRLASFADGFLARKLALRHGFVFVPETLAEWHVNPAGLSRLATSDPERADRLEAVAQAALTGDPDFPSDYAARFVARWRFAVLRLALASRDTEAIVRHYAPSTGRTGALFALLGEGGRFSRMLALSWAVVHYRPTSLMQVGWTMLKRSMEKANRR